MKVSIITVTYNSEKTLQRTIDSVVRQDYKDIEHILVDGNSTDRTLDIIKKNKSVSTYISEPDSGIYDAINKGIKLANGDIIGILNSDDALADKNIISKIVDCVKVKGSDIVYGNLIYTGKDTDKNAVVRYWKSNVYNPGCLRFGWMPPHPTLYCKKEVYDKFGLYKTSLQISSDYDFILRIFKQFNLKKSYLPIVMVKMAWGGKSNNSIKNIYNKSKEDMIALRANNIGGFYTLFLKNIRKIKQLIKGKI